MKPTRPILRYHGGKFRSAPWIVQHFPQHRVYVEPYGGAASVLMAKSRAYAEVYNDLDGEIVNLFRVLRDPANAKDLLNALSLTPFAREEFTVSYQSAEDPLEKARRTVIRSFMGFGSAAVSGQPTGFRCDSNRSGTTPAHDWVNLPKAMRDCADRLRGVVIEHSDACAVIERFDAVDTLIYADPPYPHSTRTYKARKTGQVYRHEMTDDDHRALAALLRSVQGMVVLSGYPCDLYNVELYPDWHRVTKAVLADGARPRTEVLWLNEACVCGLPQGSLAFEYVVDNR